MPRIEPGSAGWEAWTLPLCYADPPIFQKFLIWIAGKGISSTLTPGLQLSSTIFNIYFKKSRKLEFRERAFPQLQLKLRDSNFIFTMPQPLQHAAQWGATATPAAHCLLHAACCTLLAACCLLHAASCTLLAGVGERGGGMNRDRSIHIERAFSQHGMILARITT